MAPAPILLNRLLQRRTRNHFVFLVLLLLSCLSSQGQGRRPQRIDRTAAFIKEMDSIRRADSIMKVDLRRQIDQLKASDHKQRQALLEKLRMAEKEDSVRRQLQLLQLASLKASAKGFPVAPFGDTLFIIYSRFGSFTARERADVVSDKIKKLYDDYTIDPDSLTVSQTDGPPVIMYHDQGVMSINEIEALWLNKEQHVLAEEYRTVISNAIKEQRMTKGVTHLVIQLGAILLIIAGLFLVVFLINKLFKRLNQWITSLKGVTLKGFLLNNYPVLDSERELKVVLFLSNLIRLIIILITVYIALPLMFNVFPWTQGIAETLIGWVTDPLERAVIGLYEYLPNLFTILVILAVTHYFLRLMKYISGEIESGALKIPDFYPDLARPTFNIIRFLVYGFSFIMIFPYLPGSDSPVFRGVSVFIGLIFSFGSSSAIANVVSGLVITYMRPFRVGDRIKIGEITGDVIDKSLLVTRIRTIKNEIITMPNSAILSGHTVNYSMSAEERGLILNTGVTIGYDAPWKIVHELLIKAADATDDILHDEDHKPFVLQISLDDNYVSYLINVYTVKPHRMFQIYSDLHQHIQDKFNEGGVEILSPHYRATRDGNKTSIPEGYLSKDYKAPSFKISIDDTSHKKG